MHGIELQSNVHLSLKILEKDFKAQNGKHSLPSRNASSTIKELYLEHIILFKDAISYVLSFEEATGMTRSIENIDESHSTGLYPIGD